jgi:N-acetylmuramoyl-L-alanine amidase
VSSWRGNTDINARSIGIELVNPGHEFGYRDFPGAQIAALIELSRGILERHPIPARNVVGHSDVAPSRKTDPGERFPWRTLAEAGIGLWPGPVKVPPTAVAFDPDNARGTIARAQRQLRAYGYGIEDTGILDAPTAEVLVAFQRRFRPGCIDGRLDGETTGLIAAIAAACGKSA